MTGARRVAFRSCWLGVWLVVASGAAAAGGPASGNPASGNPASGDPAPGPAAVSSTVLGPFTGVDAPLHPSNREPHRIRYYGTDLGFTYLHRGKLHILFGDTWATEAYAPIEASTGAAHDDGFGIVEQLDPAVIAGGRIPLIELGQHAGSAEMAAMDPGFDMGLGKTPMAGFSDGGREFAVFNLTKPQGCRVDADCGDGLTCDTGLGYIGSPYSVEEGLTLPCIDGSSPLCRSATQPREAGDASTESGFCVDATATDRGASSAGRIASVTTLVRIGRRSRRDPRIYETVADWPTGKFGNVTVATVRRFAPARGNGDHDDRDAGSRGVPEALLLWGRPGFVGVGARRRSLGLYFAYVELPGGGDLAWRVRYFAGFDDGGVPRFSDSQADARVLDLDASRPGTQPEEVHDVVNQMSVAWIEPLGRWLMLYGGGVSRLPTAALPDCGVLQIFAGADCGDVVVGNGAVRMRTADHPWGPWSPPRDVLVGGDPTVEPPEAQYAPGGVLRHPSCRTDGCAPATQGGPYQDDEYGFLYAANLIGPWTRTLDDGVEVFWNASTWDPYRVVLVKTRIHR